MGATLEPDSTTVPIANGQSVEIQAGDPWPSAYRGSKYSVIDSRRHNRTVLQWKYHDLNVIVEPPEGLLRQMTELGKSRGSGKGSIRITADREVLTKIRHGSYVNASKAPADSGWIPVYLGRLNGDLGFDIDNDPDVSETTVWGGFPFNHGERWAVSYDGNLIWKWQDYRFESAFDHPELIEAYEQFRTTAGRLYINENGHVFVNVPRQEVPSSMKTKIDQIYTDWQSRAERNGDQAARRLVQRRLKVTGDGDPEAGHLPLYLGHLSTFDDGAIPRPVVEDETYYVACARAEELSDQ
ncbi:hypothetical protein [Halolamina salina]|uniref:Uncharacterized protein n=1 Tax=Halolamina salina TaxID=1220023 RepID=A0ABD6BBF9_9EURY